MAFAEYATMSIMPCQGEVRSDPGRKPYAAVDFPDRGAFWFDTEYTKNLAAAYNSSGEGLAA
jgi:hypothetical protein